jgi:FAD/FMN-containing dehydrogenase
VSIVPGPGPTRPAGTVPAPLPLSTLLTLLAGDTGRAKVRARVGGGASGAGGGARVGSSGTAADTVLTLVILLAVN